MMRQEKPLTQNPKPLFIFLSNTQKTPIWWKMPIFLGQKILTINLSPSVIFTFSVPKENGHISTPTKSCAALTFTNFHKKSAPCFTGGFFLTVFSDILLLFLSDGDICLWADPPVSGHRSPLSAAGQQDA